MYICQSQSRKSSRPLLSPLASICFSLCLCLYFCFVNKSIYRVHGVAKRQAQLSNWAHIKFFQIPHTCINIRCLFFSFWLTSFCMTVFSFTFFLEFCVGREAFYICFLTHLELKVTYHPFRVFGQQPPNSPLLPTSSNHNATSAIMKSSAKDRIIEFGVILSSEVQ